MFELQKNCQISTLAPLVSWRQNLRDRLDRGFLRIIFNSSFTIFDRIILGYAVKAAAVQNLFGSASWKSEISQIHLNANSLIWNHNLYSVFNLLSISILENIAYSY